MTITINFLDFITINFLDFEIKDVLSGLSLLQEQSNKSKKRDLNDLKEYITNHIKRDYFTNGK